jgi:hypothetical protein
MNEKKLSDRSGKNKKQIRILRNKTPCRVTLPQKTPLKLWLACSKKLS